MLSMGTVACARRRVVFLSLSDLRLGCVISESVVIVSHTLVSLESERESTVAVIDPW